MARDNIAHVSLYYENEELIPKRKNVHLSKSKVKPPRKRAMPRDDQAAVIILHLPLEPNRDVRHWRNLKDKIKINK